MCNTCSQPTCYGDCGCDVCPLKLDFSCIVYNKDGNDASSLLGLNLPNGSTLKLVAELLDQKIRQIDVVNQALPNIRANHVVLNLQQFNQAVDSEIGGLKASILQIGNSSNVSLNAISTSTIDFTVSGTLNHTLTAKVKIGAPESANCLVAQADGLIAVPQSLSINYITKELSISKGNTVSLNGLLPSTYLGEVGADPTSPVNGNYWYNQTQNKLKIRVNGVTKEILTA